MFNFTPLDTYDKTEPKVLKQQLDAAYHLGTSGTESNQAAVDAMNKAKADVAALNRVQQMFGELPLTDKLHKRIAYKLAQENKWLSHHTKCVDTTKKGFEKMKAAAKAAGLIDEAYAAGEAEAEKKLKLKLNNAGNLQSKDGKDSKDGKGKDVDPKFQQRDGEQRKDNQNQGQNQQDRNKEQNKVAPVTLVIENLVVAKGKKVRKYAGHTGFVQRKHN